MCPGDTKLWNAFTASAYGGAWDVKQQQANAAKIESLLVTVTETAIGILWEPADWAIALSDGVQWYDGLGMLPIIPAAFGDNIGRAVAKIIPAGLGDETVEGVQMIGRWLPDNSTGKWKRYEEFVTGVEGMVFEYNGAEFDGIIGNLNAAGSIDNLVLLDAKHWDWATYNTLTHNLNALNHTIAQARRQINAANGIQIQWHFHIKAIADWWRV